MTPMRRKRFVLHHKAITLPKSLASTQHWMSRSIRIQYEVQSKQGRVNLGADRINGLKGVVDSAKHGDSQSVAFA
jgi:hypothetical protein